MFALAWNISITSASIPQTHLLDIDTVRIDPACALKIPANIALRQKVLPFIEMDGIAHVVCLDIENHAVITVLERLLKKPVRLWAGDAAKLDLKLKQVYGDSRQTVQALPAPASGQVTQIANAVNTGDELLYAAYMRQASDIHIDPGFNGATIRFRVDGQLEHYSQISSTFIPNWSAGLKSWLTWILPKDVHPRTGGFRISLFPGSGGLTCGLRPCRPNTANGSPCVCWRYKRTP